MGGVEQEVVNGGVITQPFSYTDFGGEWKVKPNAAGQTHFHGGIDIGAGSGRPIRATRGGVVDAIGIVYLGPYAVGIRTDDGLHMVYGHCSKALVQKGQRVQAGDVIALVGSLGQSTGPHVHFAVRTDRSTEDVDHDNPFRNILDPTPYLTIGDTAPHLPTSTDYSPARSAITRTTLEVLALMDVIYAKTNEGYDARKAVSRLIRRAFLVNNIPTLDDQENDANDIRDHGLDHYLARIFDSAEGQDVLSKERAALGL